MTTTTHSSLYPFQAYKPNECIDLATDIEQEVLELSRYPHDPLEEFKTILTKVHHFNHDRLSYYEVDYKQQDIRNNAGLIYASFWESLDHLMQETKAVVEKPLHTLFEHVHSFIQHLRDPKHKRGQTEFVKKWIETCKGYHAEILKATDKERLKFRKLFAKELVFSDFRFIRKARLRSSDTDQLVSEMGAIIDQQLKDLLDIVDAPGQTLFPQEAIQIIKGKVQYFPQNIEFYQKQLKKPEKNPYETYARFVRYSNSEGRTAFNMMRLVSTCLRRTFSSFLPFHLIAAIVSVDGNLSKTN